MYKPGERYLSNSMLKTLSIGLQVLHANVVGKSKEGQHGYTTKVIEGYSFIQEFLADKIDLAFNEVIHANIFSVSTVSLDLMMIWVLHRAIDPLLLIGKVSLPNPFYMHCHNLETTDSQEVI